MRNATDANASPGVTVNRKIGSVLLLLAAFFSAAILAGGELRQFVLAGSQVLPFIILAVLAYLGVEHKWAKAAAVLWLFTLIAGYAALTLGLIAAANMDALEQNAPALLVTAFGLMAAVLTGLLGFIPSIRNQLSRKINLDPGSFVHTVALVAISSFTLISFVPLMVWGEPPFLAAAVDLMGTVGGMDAAAMQRYQAYSLLWIMAGAALAVGWGIKRRGLSVLHRLGIYRPSLKQVLGGIFLAAGLILAVQFIGQGIDRLWQRMGWTQTDNALVLELVAHALTPLGAVLTALYAGVGEELAIRGVIQPRLGILLSTLFFTGLHAPQYGWDSLLIVFALGLVMAFVRRKTNTSTSIIVHTVYDLGLFAMLI